MKKAFLAVAVALAMAASVSAQEKQGLGIYARLGVGYSFGAGKTSGGMLPAYESVRTSSTSGTVTTRTNHPFSLGNGVDLDLAFGYMFNRYIGAELGFNNMFGTNTTFESTSTSSTTSHTTLTSAKLNRFSLVPAVKLVAPIGDKFSLYSRFGIALPLSSTAVLNVETTDVSGSTRDIDKSTVKVQSYFTAGATAAIGASYALSKNFSLFVEASALVASFKAKKATITESTHNGTNQLQGAPSYQLETIYENELSSNYVQSPTEPNKDLSFNMPASSVGIRAGIAINF